jgi:prepilin-type N-terminal cleavage/methylation domain-containing protein
MYFHRLHPHPHRGFTLTELLVGIAVGVVLMVAVMAVSKTALEKAHRAGCANNIRNQLMGLLSYTSDHGKRYYWPAADTGADNAPEFLYPDYVGSLEAFICPSTRNRIRLDVIDAKTGKLRDLRNNAAHAGDERGGHSYEYFGFYTIPASQVRLEWIADRFHARKRPGHPFLPPAETVLILDGDDSGVNNFPDGTNNHGADGWHWGFADGHVRWVSAEETSARRGQGGKD